MVFIFKVFFLNQNNSYNILWCESYVSFKFQCVNKVFLEHSHTHLITCCHRTLSCAVADWVVATNITHVLSVQKKFVTPSVPCCTLWWLLQHAWMQPALWSSLRSYCDWSIWGYLSHQRFFPSLDLFSIFPLELGQKYRKRVTEFHILSTYHML